MCWFLHWIALLFQFKAVCFGKCKSISSFFRKFEATTLSPVQGLGMYGFLKFSPLWLLYSDGWWMTVITCCSPFSRPASILSDTITSQAGHICPCHRRALLTVLSHSKSRLLLSPLWRQAWIMGERLSALFCWHQTASDRSLFTELSQFPDLSLGFPGRA